MTLGVRLRTTLVLAALLVPLGALPARADWPSFLRPHAQTACPRCGGVCCCWCPDDYGRKPPPLLPPGPCQWCCDDYQRKPPPLFPLGPCKWCCDDYLRKPNVRVRLNCGPGYQCVPDCGPAPGASGS